MENIKVMMEERLDKLTDLSVGSKMTKVGSMFLKSSRLPSLY